MKTIRVKAAPITAAEPNPCAGCVHDMTAPGHRSTDQLAACLDAPPCMLNGQRYIFIKEVNHGGL